MRIATSLIILASVVRVALSASLVKRDDATPTEASPGAASTDAASQAFTGKAQYTDFAGTTACGSKVNGNDSVVGLGSDHFSEAVCDRKISITAANGKTAVATVQDSCGDGCGPNGLILTKSLFQQFYNLEKGSFQATWKFI